MLGYVITFAAATASLLLGVAGLPIAGIAVLLAGALIAIGVEQSFTIYGVEGDHQTPYMTRLVLGRLRLHIFWRGDQDPDPHDHPWGFWTFPLVTYEEEVTTGLQESIGLSEFLGIDPGTFVYRTVVRAWRLHYRPAEHTHRVIGAVRENTSPESPFRTYEQTGKPIITIVWTERVSRPWGFLKVREGIWCWVPWRQYVLEGGKDAPCAPEKADG